MTNKKDSALPTITGAGLASGDLFRLVDVSDTTDGSAGSSKVITKTELASVMGLSQDYIDALGKVTETGFQSKPTLFDPAQAAYDDGHWWQPFNVSGDTNTAMQSAGEGHAQSYHYVQEGVTTRGASHLTYVEIDDGTVWVDAGLSAQLNRDGSGGLGTLAFDIGGLPGRLYAGLSDTTAQFRARAQTGQTDPLLDLQDSNGTTKFQVVPIGSFGTFGVTPPTQSAAGTTAADAIACLKAFGLMAS